MKIKVSVILPVYNVEQYIERCIESLRAQTLADLEFIFIDDCSTDASMSAVEAWAEEDERVVILRNKERMGTGVSRNHGIEVARGDYLSFVDPDDWIAPDFYELLYTAATANGGHDIAKGRCCKVDGSSGTIGEPEARQNKKILEQLGKSDPLFRWFTYEHWTVIWRRTLFSNPEVRYGMSATAQDTTFQLKACYQTDDIVLVDNAYYYYVQIPLSATHRDLTARTYGEISALEEKVGFLLRQSYSPHGAAYIRQQVKVLFIRFQAALGAGMIGRSEIQPVVERVSSVLEEVHNTQGLAIRTRTPGVRLLERPYIVPGFRRSGEGEVRVSVVIPVYNPGQGIQACIESLRSQLLDGLEFIFVDDCSTDESMAAVEAWAAEDDRVHILRNLENLGPGPSRNRGIEAARGDYLSFVDPDDYVSRDFHELLYAAAIAGRGYDIAKGLGVEVDFDKSKNRKQDLWANESITGATPGTPLFVRFRRRVWTALYSKRLFEDDAVRFCPTRRGEDTSFLLRACFACKAITVVGDAEYFHVRRADSILHSKDVFIHGQALDSLETDIGFILQNNLVAKSTDYFSPRIEFYARHYRTMASYGSDLHAGYVPFIERLVSLLDPLPNKKQILDNAALTARLFENRSLTRPGVRKPGEGEVRISVILCVYNPGEGIRACIESLRSQLLDGLEFIIVDDCSTDESMAAVEAWANEDDRVRILKNDQNLGVGPSLNRGIETARGDYLSFIDPYDHVSPYFFDLLYAAAAADGGHEIAKGMRVETDASGQESGKNGRRINDSIGGRSSRKPLYLRFSRDHWTAIYKRSLFEDGNIRYGMSRGSEDATFTLQVCYRTEDIVIEPHAKYFFRQRQDSATNLQDVRQPRYELDGFKERVAFFKEHGFDRNAYRYLVEEVHLYLSHCFMGLQGNSLTTNELAALACALRQVVESLSDPRSLQNDCSYRALVEHYELLPGIIYLPLDHKLAGVSQWIAFVSRHPDAGYGYLGGCAGAMAQFTEQFAEEKGLRWAYARMAELAQALPLRQRSAVWFMLNCRLASARNIRKAMAKARNRACKVAHKLRVKGIKIRAV